MTYTAQDRRKNALKLKRDSRGYFIPRNTSQAKNEPTPAADRGLLSHFISTEKTANTNDSKWITLSVNDPLHKIIELLKDIKSKQTIPISLKFSLPLIALPFLMLAVFQLGRVQSGCPTITATKAGTIKNIMVMIPKPPGTFEMIRRLIPQIPQLEEPEELTPEKRVVLLDQSQNATNIIHSDKINLIQYENQPVLVTGTYSSCTQSITLDSQENISIVN